MKSGLIDTQCEGSRLESIADIKVVCAANTFKKKKKKDTHDHKKVREEGTLKVFFLLNYLLWGARGG
jgi:hypothetical protein